MAIIQATLFLFTQQNLGLIQGAVGPGQGQQIALAELRRGVQSNRTTAIPQQGHHGDPCPTRQIQLPQLASQAGTAGAQPQGAQGARHGGPGLALGGPGIAHLGHEPLHGPQHLPGMAPGPKKLQGEGGGKDRQRQRQHQPPRRKWLDDRNQG